MTIWEMFNVSAGSPKGSPKNSPKNSPKAARALLPTTSSSALKPNNSPLSRVSISADRIATSALASHPYRPLYLSGASSTQLCRQLDSYLRYTLVSAQCSTL